MYRFRYFLLVILFMTFSLSGCLEADVTSSGTSSASNSNNTSNWLIPSTEVIEAQGRDVIPSIEKPNFTIARKFDFLTPDSRVLGVEIENQTFAFPVSIISHHEVVNLDYNGTSNAITYCPLTGTGIAWESNLEFGVSGLLFRNNLIAYDRNTNSYWSQMQMRAVHGAHSGTQPELIDIVETSWETWKAMYPESKVLNTNTGYDRSYERNSGSNSIGVIAYPISNRDQRLGKFVRVHGIIEDTVANEKAAAKVYEISKFGDKTRIINETFNGRKMVIAGNTEDDFAVSFYATLGDSIALDFEAVQDELPIIMKDQQGNRWNIFGKAVSGPYKGTQLKPGQAYTGLWFAWSDFFPNSRIHDFSP